MVRTFTAALRRRRLATCITPIVDPGDLLPVNVPDKIVLPDEETLQAWLRRALWPDLPLEREWRGLEETAPNFTTSEIAPFLVRWEGQPWIH